MWSLLKYVSSNGVLPVVVVFYILFHVLLMKYRIYILSIMMCIVHHSGIQYLHFQLIVSTSDINFVDLSSYLDVF